MSPHARPAVVLLSGGLDSATVLAIARSEGFVPHALSFRYGQRHAVELAAAKRVAKCQGVARHVTIEIDARPSDAIAVAVTCDPPLPIYVSEEVLNDVLGEN